MFLNFKELLSSIFGLSSEFGVRLYGSGGEENFFSGKDYKPGMTVISVRVEDATQIMDLLKGIHEQILTGKIAKGEVTQQLKTLAELSTAMISYDNKGIETNLGKLLKDRYQNLHGKFIQVMEPWIGEYFNDTLDHSASYAKHHLLSDTVDFYTLKGLPDSTLQYWQRKFIKMRKIK